VVVPVPAPPAGYYPPTTSYPFVYGGRGQSQAAQLAKQYVKATKEDEKKDIRKKLTEELAQQFDVHVKQQQKELEDLENQIAEVKAQLKKRTDNKSAIIERRFDQLVQEAEGLGWNAPSTPRPVYGPTGAGVGGFPTFPTTRPPEQKPAEPKK
jgi:hypothetical protein